MTGGITSGVTYFGIASGSWSPPGSGAADAAPVRKRRMAKALISSFPVRWCIIVDVLAFLVVGMVDFITADSRCELDAFPQMSEKK
jgi:hypothetical protein